MYSNDGFVITISAASDNLLYIKKNKLIEISLSTVIYFNVNLVFDIRST